MPSSSPANKIVPRATAAASPPSSASARWSCKPARRSQAVSSDLGRWWSVAPAGGADLRGRLAEQQAAPPQKLRECRPTKPPKPPRHPLVCERPQLLGHREASLSKAALRRCDREMEGVREVGPRERDGKRETKRRAVELINRDDDERPGLCLLGAAGGIRVGPHDIALARRPRQYSGRDASKPPSSPVSTR